LQETVVLEAAAEADDQDRGTADGQGYVWWCGRNISILNPPTLSGEERIYSLW